MPHERFDRLGVLRGVAMIWMAVYHFFFARSFSFARAPRASRARGPDLIPGAGSIADWGRHEVASSASGLGSVKSLLGDER